MPYIHPVNRPEFHPMIDDIAKQICSDGELNYVLTSICVKYLEEIQEGTGKNNYGQYAMVVAALECAKLELYRRVVAVYEDEKCKINGDVY